MNLHDLILPFNFRIVLKDFLKIIPWILSLNPILFYRKKVNKKYTKKRNSEIKDTLEKWGGVFIYPEWTRSDELWELNKNYFKSLFDTVKNTKEIKNKVVMILTMDNNHIFNFKLEKWLIWKWNINKWTINLTIDLVDISNMDIDEFTKYMGNKILLNLNNKK